MNDKTNNKWGVKPTNSTATEELKESVKVGKLKKLTFDVPEELHLKFKIYAAQNGTTMGQLINTFIHNTVNK